MNVNEADLSLPIHTHVHTHTEKTGLEKQQDAVRSNSVQKPKTGAEPFVV